MADGQTQPVGKLAPTQEEQERAVGITTLITPDAPVLECVFKQRYTDFQVNEIIPSGEVLHLQEIAAPPSKESKKRGTQKEDDTDEAAKASGVHSTGESTGETDEPSSKRVKLEDGKQAKENGFGKASDVSVVEAEDLAEVEQIFGQDTTSAIVELYHAILRNPERKPRDHATIKSAPIESKATRTQGHGIIRKAFRSKLETATLQNEPGCMSIRAAQPHAAAHVDSRAPRANRNNNPNQRARADWKELGGEYLHFTLYKENKDTMEVMYFMASELKIKISSLQFAGTKDRRGVTVQRVALHRIQKERLLALTRIAKGWKIGGFEYKPHGLRLGDLQGNEFTLTLRDLKVAGIAATDVEGARAAVKQSAEAFASQGYLNFYGLQRFGAFSTGTHVTGMKMIQGDLEGAIDGILIYDQALLPENLDASAQASTPRDDISRAQAIHIWRTTGDINKARQLMPRRFQAEMHIMQALSRRHDGKTMHNRDWQGALMSIQRALRLMYVHAYQSFVWNTIAAERWRRHGSDVVQGDLIVVGEKEEEVEKQPQDTVDQDGEDVVHASASADQDEPADDSFMRARPLSLEEANSGRYDIHDIVLPLPGWDVIYPANDSGKYYETFMASDEGGKLNPHDMRRAWKDVSLSGGYRKLMAKPLNGVSVDVLPYQGEQQLVQTDVDRLTDRSLTHHEAETGEVAEDPKLAIVMRFQLGSSQYATMALRELTKGGAKAYTPEFAIVR